MVKDYGIVCTYKGVHIYKSEGINTDGSVLWVLYYADGFPHKVGRLTLNRISGTSINSVKSQITRRAVRK